MQIFFWKSCERQYYQQRTFVSLHDYFHFSAVESKMKQIFIFLSVCSALWTVKAKKCERLREPMCKGIRYNFTTLPNGLGHPTQERARLEFHKFYPLLNRKCSKYLKEFMCAVYFPECRENGKGPLVMPSREQCQESYKGCAHVMEKYGFEWPRNLNCYNFPGKFGT